jgi:hypothetical protein
MPIPPTNTTPATAYDLTGLLPLSDTIDLTGMSGSLNNQKTWYKFTFSTEFAISIWAQKEEFGGTTGAYTGFSPNIRYWFGLPSNPDADWIESSSLGPVEIFAETSIGVPSTITVYISIHNGHVWAGQPIVTPTVPTLIKCEKALNIAVPAGSVLVSNDTPDHPAVFVKPDGTFSQVRPFVALGESSAILENGISLWAKDNGDHTQLVLYDVNFVEITTVTWPIRDALRDPISSNRIDTFYIGSDDKVTTISSVGVLGDTTWTIPTASYVWHIAPSLVDDDIIYIKTNSGIHKFHKSTSVLDTAFIPYTILVGGMPYFNLDGFYGQEFIVMPDDTIVTLYSSTVYNPDPLKRGETVYYNPDGTVIREILMQDEDVNRIAYGSGVSVTTRSSIRRVWTWSYTFEFKSRIVEYDLTTGFILFEFTLNSTSYSISFTEEEIPDEMFGIPESCPLTTTTVDLPPYGEDVVIPPDPPATDVSGIYFINPVKTTKHDSYYNDIEKKIPNPTIRTALIGE